MKVARWFVLLGWFGFFAARGIGGTLVEFQMFNGITNANSYLGEVDVELYDMQKPVTVKNFINLVNSNAYGNSFFHRLVPGFVLQGGSFWVEDPFATNAVAPPYGFPFPFSNIEPINSGTITNEFLVGPLLPNTNWTIAMALGATPNTASSGFFFNLADNSALLDNTNNSGGFVVFGHTLRGGTNILAQFNGLSYNLGGLVDLTKIYGSNGLFNQLPDRYPPSNAPPYTDLVYFEVSLLSASIVQTNGSRQISWNSVNGLTNYVEYATNLPGTWLPLTNVIGNADTITVTDSSTAAKRYYRVRVAF